MSKKNEAYEAELEQLQIALVDSQVWAIEQGKKILVIFEGRDTAGKGGAIKRVTEHMAMRQTRVVSLPKPSDREVSQWYFQRYAAHLPAAGEIVLFDRSWYNRAGVEVVMGFSTPEEQADFIRDVPRFEEMLVEGGIQIIKFWLDISKAEQAERLAARVGDPLKKFKISSLDGEAQKRWDDYSAARDAMLPASHSRHAPWTLVATDKKKQARLNVLRHLVREIGAPGITVPVKKPDSKICFAFKPSALIDGRLAR
jgi:polyphosphate kinase 2